MSSGLLPLLLDHAYGGMILSVLFSGVSEDGSGAVRVFIAKTGHVARRRVPGGHDIRAIVEASVESCLNLEDLISDTMDKRATG